MKSKTRSWIILISIVLTLISLVLLARLTAVYQSTRVQIMPSYLIVSDSGGVGLVPGVVFFGRMRPGDTAVATINVNSSFDYTLWVNISARGDMSQFMIGREFILEPYENRSVDITAVVPRDALFGRYDGQIVITTRKTFFAP